MAFTGSKADVPPNPTRPCRHMGTIRRHGKQGSFVGKITEAWFTDDVRKPHVYFIVEDPKDGMGWHRVLSELVFDLANIDLERAAA